MGCGKSKSIDLKVMMVGLDAAGKTTVLYRLHKGERIDTEPTLGFNVEVIDHNGAKAHNMGSWWTREDSAMLA